MEPGKSAFFNIVNSRYLGILSSTALSIHIDWAPLENVKALISTLVKL
jgi:hypothetical protein